MIEGQHPKQRFSTEAHYRVWWQNPNNERRIWYGFTEFTNAQAHLRIILTDPNNTEITLDHHQPKHQDDWDTRIVTPETTDTIAEYRHNGQADSNLLTLLRPLEI